MNTANLRLRGRWLLALFASLFLAVGASAQNEVEIQGRVTADGQPLVGASVIIKGTTTGTSTDIAGNFTVRAKNGAVLSVGFVGYKTREVAVTAGVTFLDIVLEAEEALIDDVVVIGYGSMKKSDLTGAVSGFADCTGHYLPLACTINGSRILDAGRAALGVDYDELAKLAFASKPGANGITLVPYFDGERTPNRPNATATFSGMTLANTTRENLARAFVEGLLCSQRDCLELIRSLGASITRILLIGGGAKSEAIRTLAPSILGMDVTRPATDEYVAIGAARQAAWVLSGETEPPAWQLTIDGVETGEPTEAVYEAYAKARG